MTTQTKLDDFTRAYVGCALWSTNDNSDESGGDPLDENYDWTDLSPETLSKIVSDCQAFQSKHGHLWCDCESPRPGEWNINEQAGHDFWLTRNGHGSGFWDRRETYDGQADRLTEACKSCGECNIYVGDDGQLHL